jgi:hypothetical protein
MIYPSLALYEETLKAAHNYVHVHDHGCVDVVVDVHVDVEDFCQRVIRSQKEFILPRLPDAVDKKFAYRALERSAIVPRIYRIASSAGHHGEMT